MSCPDKKWLATNKTMEAGVIPSDLEDRVRVVWEDIKTGKAKNNKVKKEMIELYNTIYNASYDSGTNCASCLQKCYNGMKKIIESFN